MAHDMKGRQYIKAKDAVVEVTLSTDTSAYADGDLLADTQIVENVGLVRGEVVKLKNITVLDAADQGQAMTVLLLDGTASLGTENDAPSPSDAVAANVLGAVAVGTADYVDLTNSQVATVGNVDLVMQCPEGGKSLYVAALAGGVATYGTADITLKLGFER